MAARFPIGTILAISDHPKAFLPRFESTGLLVQEKKQNIDFQDGRHSDHLGLPTGTILALFHLQVTLMIPTEFQVN